MRMFDSWSFYFLIGKHIHIFKYVDMFWFSLCVSATSFELARFYFNQRAFADLLTDPLFKRLQQAPRL
jgi:hypothetical protein